MPARWKTGLALLALTVVAPLAAEPLTPQAMIARCAASADTRLTGIADLSRACPGIRPALEQLGWTVLLPPRWPEKLTARGLADLAALTQRYGGSMPAAAPGTAALQSIAAGLVPAPQPASWSDRIRALIQHWAASALHAAGKWLRSSLEPVLRHSRPGAIFYGLAALLLIVVAVLLTFELRGAGLVRALRRAPPPLRRALATRLTGTVAREYGEPDWPRLQEQPARVLRLLVETLVRARRLDRDRHLTCRELAREARFDSESEREGFARVARLAECELYGPRGATLVPEDMLRDARTLHARLLLAGEQGGGDRQ